MSHPYRDGDKPKNRRLREYFVDRSRWLRVTPLTAVLAAVLLAGVALAAASPSLRVNGLKFPDGTNAPGGFYNVKAPEYNCAGDNSTDDTACIQAAITAATSAGGGTVFLPKGTYNVTTLVATTASHLTIQSTGATLYGTVATDSIIDLETCTHCKVTGLSIRHFVGATHNNSGNAIKINNCTDVEISGNEIYDVTSSSAWIFASSYITVDKNYMHDTLADGVHIAGVSTNLGVTNNRFLNMGDDSIAVDGAQSEAGTCSNITIANNTIMNGVTRGMFIGGASYVSIVGNTIEHTQDAGILVAQDPSYGNRGDDNITVAGNTLTNTNYTAVNGGSIYVESPNTSWPVVDVLVIGNTVNGGGYQMIGVGAAALGTYRVDVIGNKCSGPNTAAAGIGFSYVTGGTVKGNYVNLAQGHGIVADANSLNITMSDNTVYFPNQGNTAGKSGVLNSSVSGVLGNNFVTADPGVAALNATAAATFQQGAMYSTGIASTAGSTVQSSSTNTYEASAWDTTSLDNETVHFQWKNVPTSGHPILGNLQLYYDLNGTGATLIARINPTGAYVGGGLAFNSGNSYDVGASGTMGRAIYMDRYVAEPQTIAAATSITINPASGSKIRITLSATNITSITYTAGNDGERSTVCVVEDGTGSRTIPTTWTNVKFAGGSYTATATASKIDCLSFTYSSTDSAWLETGRAMAM